ncbi:hypothetical protein GCM10011588_35660 [Nocardia jinanensis]|uniref:Uncharacterized protein n=1 Tax=Nocardia jinanensis TaxID=382504 RepID=A0A917RPY8_9NOCA|nr:hypothetical protein GCM10011588_35660 [Nocardia jinanensis]
MIGGCPEPNGYEGACPQFGTGTDRTPDTRDSLIGVLGSEFGGRCPGGLAALLRDILGA